MEKKFWLVGIVGWLLLRIALPILTSVASGYNVVFSLNSLEMQAFIREGPVYWFGFLLLEILIITIIAWSSSGIWKKYKARKS